jgi:hypothetical protein
MFGLGTMEGRQIGKLTMQISALRSDSQVSESWTCESVSLSNLSWLSGLEMTLPSLRAELERRKLRLTLLISQDH